MSRNAALLAEVTMPIFRGNAGIGRLRSGRDGDFIYFWLADPAAGRNTLLLNPEKSEGAQKYSPSSVPGTKTVLAAAVTHGCVYVLGSIIVICVSIVP